MLPAGEGFRSSELSLTGSSLRLDLGCKVPALQGPQQDTESLSTNEAEPLGRSIFKSLKRARLFGPRWTVGNKWGLSNRNTETWGKVGDS